MTNSINSKYNLYNQQNQGSPSYGALPLPANVSQINGEAVKQTVNQTVNQSVSQTPIVGDMASQDKANLWKVGLTIPIGLGIGAWMNKFNKSCAGDYSESLPGKIGNRIDDLVTNHKFFKSKPYLLVSKLFESSGSFVKDKIINKSKILRNLANLNTTPKNKIALTTYHGTIAELAADATQILGEFTDSGKNIAKLGNPKLTQAMYDAIIENPTGHIDDILDICKNPALKDEFVQIKKIMNVPIPKAMGRTIYFSEIANKLTALKGSANPMHATGLAKAAPKAFLRTIEGLTNGTAGGKFMILVQAYFLADALVQSYNAPKGEKIKTFMENMIYNLSFYLTMPLGMSIMHKIGGLQYLGIGGKKPAKGATLPSKTAAEKILESKQNVEIYRNRVTELNKKVLSGTISKQDYLAEVKDLKTFLKGDSKWYHKPFKFVAKLLTVGDEQIRPFKVGGSNGNSFFKSFIHMFKDFKGYKAAASNYFKNALKHPVQALKTNNYWLKQGLGYPARFLFFFVVVSSQLAKISTKAGHAIFGRPTKSVLDSEPEEPAKGDSKAQPQPQPTTSVNAPTPAVNPANAPKQVNQNPLMGPNPKNNPATNLINQYKQNPPPAPVKKTYTYIPSPTGVKIEGPQGVNPDQRKVDMAIGKTTTAEQNALKMLNY